MRYSKIIAVFLIACAVITLFIFSYFYHRYNQVQFYSNQGAIKEAVRQLDYSKHESIHIREQLFSTISLLSHGSQTYQYVTSPSLTTREVFEHVLTSAVKGQKWFVDIGFIDNRGLEQVHLNYQFHSNNAEFDAQVTNIANSELFKYAQTLLADEVGVWAAELDNDPETFITPYSPTIQVITPITVAGVRYGYIVGSVDVSTLVDKLNYSPQADMTPAIVGGNGFLVTGSSALPFYGDFTNRYHGFNFPEFFPKTWQEMRSGSSNNVMEDANLIVFQPLDDFFGKSVQLVIRFTPKQLANRASHDLNDVVKEGLFFFMIMLVFALPTASMSLHYYHRNIESKLARAALDGMTAVMISDTHHQVIMVNKEFEKTVGLSIDEIQGLNALKTLLSHNGMEFVLNVLELVSENNFWEGEVECITRDGTLLTTIMRIQAIIEAGKVSYYITSLVDISERKELENKLRELSEKDSLTHLWNRRKFERELTLQTQLIERYPNDFDVSLCLIDIDYFKRINDEQGHDEGDKVIIQIAKVLSERLRTTDFIARIGGEEFAIIMPHTSVEEAQIVVERLRYSIELDQSLPVTISAGISDLSNDGARSYKCADIALYESKTLGRNQVSLCLTTDDLA